MEGPPCSCLLERSAQHKLELCTHCQKIAKLSNCEGWSGRSNCSRTVRYSPVIPPTDPSRDAGHVMAPYLQLCSNESVDHACATSRPVRASCTCLMSLSAGRRTDGGHGAAHFRFRTYVLSREEGNESSCGLGLRES